MEMAGRFLAGLVVNYGVYYGSMALHNQWCMPHSPMEVIKGLVVAASPMCSTLLSVGQTTQNSYGVILTTAVGTLVTSVKSITL